MRKLLSLLFLCIAIVFSLLKSSFLLCHVEKDSYSLTSTPSREGNSLHKEEKSKPSISTLSKWRMVTYPSLFSHSIYSWKCPPISPILPKNIFQKHFSSSFSSLSPYTIFQKQKVLVDTKLSEKKTMKLGNRLQNNPAFIDFFLFSILLKKQNISLLEQNISYLLAKAQSTTFSKDHLFHPSASPVVETLPPIQLHKIKPLFSPGNYTVLSSSSKKIDVAKCVKISPLTLPIHKKQPIAHSILLFSENFLILPLPHPLKNSPLPSFSPKQELLSFSPLPSFFSHLSPWSHGKMDSTSSFFTKPTFAIHPTVLPPFPNKKKQKLLFIPSTLERNRIIGFSLANISPQESHKEKKEDLYPNLEKPFSKNFPIPTALDRTYIIEPTALADLSLSPKISNKIPFITVPYFPVKRLLFTNRFPISTTLALIYQNQKAAPLFPKKSYFLHPYPLPETLSPISTYIFSPTKLPSFSFPVTLLSSLSFTDSPILLSNAPAPIYAKHSIYLSKKLFSYPLPILADAFYQKKQRGFSPLPCKEIASSLKRNRNFPFSSSFLSISYLSTTPTFPEPKLFLPFQSLDLPPVKSTLSPFFSYSPSPYSFSLEEFPLQFTASSFQPSCEKIGQADPYSIQFSHFALASSLSSTPYPCSFSFPTLLFPKMYDSFSLCLSIEKDSYSFPSPLFYVPIPILSLEKDSFADKKLAPLPHLIVDSLASLTPPHNFLITKAKKFPFFSISTCTTKPALLASEEKNQRLYEIEKKAIFPKHTTPQKLNLTLYLENNPLEPSIFFAKKRAAFSSPPLAKLSSFSPWEDLSILLQKYNDSLDQKEKGLLASDLLDAYRYRQYVPNHFSFLSTMPLSALFTLEHARTKNNYARMTSAHLSNLQVETQNTFSLHNTLETTLYYTKRKNKPGYLFELNIKPNKALAFPSMAQNFIFIIDGSGTITKRRYEAFKAGVVKSMRYLQDGDSYTILIADAKVASMSKKSLLWNKKSLAHVKHYLKNREYRGFFSRYDTFDLLSKAQSYFTPDKHNVIILLTDGHSLEDLTHHSADLLALDTEKKEPFSLFTASASHGNNFSMLDLISTFHGGEFMYAQTNASFPRKLAVLTKHIKHLITSNLYLEAVSHANPHIEFYPGPKTLPSLYSDRSYTIYGTAENLEDFDLLLQGRVGKYWIHIKQHIALSTAEKGGRSLERNFALQQAYVCYNYYLDQQDTFFLAEAKRLLKPHSLPCAVQ